MQLFYKNWIEIKKVRVAFDKAQDTMRKKYKNDPNKWAAFVFYQ